MKIVIVGDGSVGKTCICSVYATNGVFPNGYAATVFENTTIRVRGREAWHNAILMDTAGQEEYAKLRPICYQEANIFIVCFSVTEPASFANVKNVWIPELKQNCPKTPYILVGTKTDLREDLLILDQLANNKLEPITAKQGKCICTSYSLHDFFKKKCLFE